MKKPSTKGCYLRLTALFVEDSCALLLVKHIYDVSIARYIGGARSKLENDIDDTQENNTNTDQRNDLSDILVLVFLFLGGGILALGREDYTKDTAYSSWNTGERQATAKKHQCCVHNRQNEP